MIQGKTILDIAPGNSLYLDPKEPFNIFSTITSRPYLSITISQLPGCCSGYALSGQTWGVKLEPSPLVDKFFDEFVQNLGRTCPSVNSLVFVKYPGTDRYVSDYLLDAFVRDEATVHECKSSSHNGNLLKCVYWTPKKWRIK